MSQNLWVDEPLTWNSRQGKSMLHRQSFSLEQGAWMIEEYEKQGFKVLVLDKKHQQKPSYVMSKTGQPKIVLHYTTIGGFGQYYCMVFPENTDIPGHPFKLNPNNRYDEAL